MGSFSSLSRKNVQVIFQITFLSLIILASGSNRFQDFDITWGEGRGKIVNNGDLLTLSLDHYSGSGFQSKKEYLFGKIDMQLKLVPGNSAGTVTALYLSSASGGFPSDHDEIDFEFLGNVSGEPYTVHTNVYSRGKGEREQQFRLWFDPTADFHTYSFLWTTESIVFSVDSTPLRQFKNLEKMGVPYPKSKPMRLYSSIWNAEEWATRGGLVKTDWARAPFSASYRGFSVDNISPKPMDQISRDKLKWAQKNYMIYNYCSDTKRFPLGFPAECYANN